MTLDRTTVNRWSRYGGLALIWGLSFMFISIGVQALAPLQVALVRLIFGGVTLILIMLLRGQKLPRGWRMWGHLAVAGLTYNAIPFTLFAFAATLIPSALLGVVNATTPLFTLLLALMVLPTERPTPVRVAGIVVGFAGIVVVMGGPAIWQDIAGGIVSEVVLGTAMCLAASASYGVASVYTRRYLTTSGHPTVSLAAGQVIAGAVLVALITPAFSGWPSELPLHVVLSMLALGCLGTGAAYLLFYGLVRDLGATAASTVTYLLPVVAVVAGALVLDEKLTWYQLLGGALVLVGAVLAQHTGSVRAAR
ncbi:MAG TPA: DMT family transporter [Actinopolymorphaceae bacterium]|jgi:drug/metabolite transporter (DMT)-like permease